jgi:hypothetical protein
VLRLIFVILTWHVRVLCGSLSRCPASAASVAGIQESSEMRVALPEFFGCVRGSACSISFA